MTGWPSPPPLARWLLERALPVDVREAVSGDLDEVFQRDCRRYGPGWARLRYWRKAVSFSRHFVVERWRDRRRGGVMRTGMSWLDVKLSLRMLVRYPGLSLAGGLGIAVVIACGTAAAVFDAVVHGTLPFEDGDRVVALENWDTSRNDPEYRALHDFVSWRDELRTVEDIGAYRLMNRNVTAAGRSAEPVRIAEITAAAFQVARVPPLVGRYLVGEDELEGAPPVVVIGHDEWQRRFAGDPQVVGRTLQVGDTTFTVVGVMPEGFGFPVNERYWIPLRLKPSDYERGQGPVIYLFGRLADGADLGAAQAELTVIGQRAAVDFPDTHARLRPRVLPYTEWFFAEMLGPRDAGPGPWLEIVGVVRDFPPEPMESTVADATLYHPVGRGDAQGVLLAVRVRGVAATALASRLREIATALDGSLQLREIRSMDALLREQQSELRMAAWLSGVITMSVLLLSATGLYALMAFAVVQRRREIGIRLALGANPRRILGSIITRALWQLATGIVVGVAIAAQLDMATEGELTGGTGRWMLPAVAAFVLLVGLIAAAGPARRGLRLQPTEALREE